MGGKLCNLWSRFKSWISGWWKPLVESYVKDKERKGAWSRYGIPAGVLLLIVTALVGNMLRFQIIPAQYFIFVGTLYLIAIFTLSTIVVTTSARALGKLALPLVIIAIIVVSIAILKL